MTERVKRMQPFLAAMLAFVTFAASPVPSLRNPFFPTNRSG